MIDLLEKLTQISEKQWFLIYVYIYTLLFCLNIRFNCNVSFFI